MIIELFTTATSVIVVLGLGNNRLKSFGRKILGWIYLKGIKFRGY